MLDKDFKQLLIGKMKEGGMGYGPSIKGELGGKAPQFRIVHFWIFSPVPTQNPDSYLWFPLDYSGRGEEVVKINME